jgi:hypothetical protein
MKADGVLVQRQPTGEFLHVESCSLAAKLLDDPLPALIGQSAVHRDTRVGGFYHATEIKTGLAQRNPH